MNLLNLFYNKRDENFILPERKIHAEYILNEINRSEYIKKGYTIIRNIADDASLGKIIDTHYKMTKISGYFESEKFQSSIAFGKNAYQLGIDTVNEVSTKIFTSILDNNLCKYDMGGSILIKNKGCFLGPHQGTPLIDEYAGTTTYAWVPTVDITGDNGTFYVLEGSHHWAAWQRSSQLNYWSLNKYADLLWKKMEPLFLNKGDVLLFDSALIHASGENKTGKIRLAVNVCIVEKKAQFVQYIEEKDTPKGMIEKYFVDEDYWHAGNFSGRPEEKYRKIMEKKIYPKALNKKFILSQIEKFKA